MSESTNFFKYVEVIEARGAKSLALKLSSIRGIAFQITNIWSDGSNHYAMINPGRPLPAKVKEALAKEK